MSAPQNINTIVRGSVGMLRDAANDLDKAHRAAEQANDAHYRARNIAYESWRGEGAEAFLNDLERQLDITRNLAHTCEVYSQAFDELAGALEVVKNDMDKIRSTAIAGGLRVQGPMVLRPERPGSAPSASDYVGNAAGYADAMHAYQAQVDAYNAKVETFNTCLAIYKEARNKEKQAHIDFWNAVQAGHGFDLDGAWNLGSTTASAALGALAGMENSRSDLLAKLRQLEPHSQTYQALASGRTTLAGLSAKERMRVMNDLARTKASEVNYRKQIKQLNKVSEYVPEKLQRLAAANPSQLAKNPRIAAKLGKVFRGLPWAASMLTVFNQVKSAATGAQTWGRAVAETVGVLGGGWAGGWIGSVFCLPYAPPWGSIVCGTIGGIAGGFAGDLVVDFVVPEDSNLPEKAHKIPDHPNAPPGFP